MFHDRSVRGRLARKRAHWFRRTHVLRNLETPCSPAHRLWRLREVASAAIISDRAIGPADVPPSAFAHTASTTATPATAARAKATLVLRNPVGVNSPCVGDAEAARRSRMLHSTRPPVYNARAVCETWLRSRGGRR